MSDAQKKHSDCDTEYYTSGLFEEEIMLAKMALRVDGSHVVTPGEKKKTKVVLELKEKR